MQREIKGLWPLAILLAIFLVALGGIAAVVDNAGGITISSSDGTMNLNTHLVHNGVDPVSAQDLATKHYIDTRTLNNILTPTADFAMNSFGLTGTRDGIARQEPATYGELANPFSVYEYVSDFDTQVSASAGPWFISSVANSGTVTGVSTGQDATHLGIWQLNTVTSTASRACITMTSAVLPWNISSLGQDELDVLVQVPTLCDGTQSCSFEIGVGDQVTTTTQNNGVYFRYNSAEDLHWQMCTAGASSRTCTATTDTVTAGVWERMTAKKSEGSTHWAFSTNGVSTGITSSSNEPAAAVGAYACMIRSAGTTSRTVLLDIFRFKNHYNAERGS